MSMSMKSVRYTLEITYFHVCANLLVYMCGVAICLFPPKSIISIEKAFVDLAILVIHGPCAAICRVVHVRAII
jgi:hypothetical protein